MRDLLRDYYDGRLSRRAFFGRLVATGLTASAARSIIEAAGAGGGLEPQVAAAPPASVQAFSGTGGELLVEQVKAAGTRYVFTNPGSTEVGFFDALTDRPELEVVVGLHEGIVVGMADAYQKISRQPTFVNVHAAVGTAQMGGQLYNAHTDGSALIITAGMNDNTLFSDEVGLGATAGFSQAEITREFTKLSWDVRNGSSMAVAVRRAYKLASTSPGGPVYMALSTRGLAEPAKGEVWPKEAFLIDARPRPAADQVQALARMLIDAKRPIVVMGDEVYKADAAADALALCDLLGLPIATAGMSAFQYISSDNPLFVGRYGVGDRPYPANGADLVVQLGGRDPGAGVVPDTPIRQAGVRYVAVGLDTAMIGRTRALDLAVVGHVRESLRDVKEAVGSIATKDRLAKLRDERLAVVTPATKAANDARLRSAKNSFEQTPIHPDRLGYELEQ